MHILHLNLYHMQKFGYAACSENDTTIETVPPWNSYIIIIINLTAISTGNYANGPSAFKHALMQACINAFNTFYICLCISTDLFGSTRKMKNEDLQVLKIILLDVGHKVIHLNWTEQCTERENCRTVFYCRHAVKGALSVHK